MSLRIEETIFMAMVGKFDLYRPMWRNGIEALVGIHSENGNYCASPLKQGLVNAPFMRNDIDFKFVIGCI